MAVTSPQAQNGVDARGKPLQGLKSGKVTELTMFYTVKPGHEEAIRAAVVAFTGDPKRMDAANEDVLRLLVKIGIHELRFVLFDNDRRLLWTTSFDTDWDPYIDDTFAALGNERYGSILQHTQEAPEGIGRADFPNPAEAAKDLFNAVRVTAAGYVVTFADVPLTEQLQNVRLRQAFDEVLDNPGAAEGLQHPALKPLLDIAAG